MPTRPGKKYQFLFLEPFFGGSHRDFAEGLMEHSRHGIDIITMPSRFWKWRMRGAALHFSERIPRLDRYDGIITTNLMSLSDFKALCGYPCPPCLVYFHENQITYPLAPGETPDYQFGFTDITTALAADRVLFNSHTHFNAFFARLPDFLGMMPDYRPGWIPKAIRSRAGVLHPGCRFYGPDGTSLDGKDAVPLIIWNHRWEFDKNPADFFSAVYELVDRGLDFRVALLGENFQAVPKPFLTAHERLKDRIIQFGYVASRQEYIQWLMRGAIVISTAIQENFGISVVEAVRFGCLPLLPFRLSYPEIIPEPFHDDCFYRDQRELTEKLASLIENSPSLGEKRRDISNAMADFAWEKRVIHYDRELEDLTLSRR